MFMILQIFRHNVRNHVATAPLSMYRSGDVAPNRENVRLHDLTTHGNFHFENFKRSL